LAKQLPEIQFHIVGGRDEELENWRKTPLPENLTLHGFVEPGRICAVRESFDVLLLPAQRRVLGATGNEDISRWMSPLKLFEYMSSGKPIVASDLPVIREVLTDGKNALLVDPESLAGWATAVERLWRNTELSARLAETAKRDFEAHYTWDARAEAVLEGLER
ncbi:MAG: glycosyltransferase family 4 protein, partial [Planctomycetota bacterium]